MSASEYMKSFAYEAGGVMSKFGGLTADAVESGAIVESAFYGNWNDVGERSSELLFGTLGAAFGALLGSFVGPGGTAVGTAIGGAVGSYYGEVWWNHFFGDNYLPPPPPPLGDEDPIPASPLVLDLNGDGVSTTAVGENVHFDLDANGFSEMTGWVAPSDGLLALDLNGDGVIGDGTELFGNWTRLESGERASNGFEALAEYDQNADGVISESDTIFSKLRVWRDLDQDGVSDAGELFTLEEVGVSDLSLGYENSSVVDEAGNEHRQIGTFETATGEQRALVDVWFQRDLKRTVGEKLEVPAQIALLPDAVGYGNVHSLHQAMIRDDSGLLQELVEQFVAESDASQRNSLVTEILFQWAGQTDADKNRYAGYEGTVDGRKIGVLEAFWGKKISGPRGAGTQYAENFHGRYAQWENAVFYQLMAQSHLREVFAKVDFTFDESTEAWVGDYDAAATYVMEQIVEDPANNTMMLADFYRAVQGVNPYDKTNGNAAHAELHEAGSEVGEVLTEHWAPLLESGQESSSREFVQFMLQGGMFSMLSGWSWGRNALASLMNDAEARGNLSDLIADSAMLTQAGSGWSYGHGGVDVMIGSDAATSYLRGRGGDDLLIAGKGDHLYGEGGDDVLIGAEGARLDAGDGNDRLVAAAGARLEGGAGNDTYRFDKGAGLATVEQNDGEGRDVIEFGEGIAASDLVLRKSGNDLHLLIGEEGLRMQSWFSHSNYRTAAFRFADGTEVSTQELMGEKTVLSEASAGGGWLHGYDGADVMIGHDEQTSYLRGHGGDDLLIAGRNSRLYGDGGNDMLVGAEGAYLYGGSGADEYIFQDRFHGSTVYADSATDGPADVARFEDASSESLWFQRSGDNLLVDSLGDDQRVTFANWYDGASYRPGEIHAGDQVATAEQVNRLVTAMAEFAPPSGEAGGAIPEDVRTALAPELAVSWSTAA